MHSIEESWKNRLIPQTEVKFSGKWSTKAPLCAVERWVWEREIATNFFAIDDCESKSAQMVCSRRGQRLKFKVTSIFFSLSFSSDSSSIAQFRNWGRLGKSISKWFMWRAWIAWRLITNHRLIMRVVKAQAFLSIDCFKVAADKTEMCAITWSSPLVSCREFSEWEVTWKS